MLKTRTFLNLPPRGSVCVHFIPRTSVFRVGWGRVGLIALLGTCTPTWCYVRDGVGWGMCLACYACTCLARYASICSMSW